MANRRYIDFPIASTSGDTDIILIWQGGANKQTTKATFLSGLPENLDELNDVAISGLTNGQILRYDSVTGKWENTDQGNLDLNDLNDVSIVSPSNGQVLVYNSSTGKWENSSGGYVPYTGAVTTVNLGAQTIQAGQFVKAGGTAAQFLKADGSVDSNVYGTGTVTSVALTMPSAFSVANSPITTSGTLAVTGAGNVGQYIRGDGSLADFPESSGGGSSVSYYLNGSVAQGTIGGIAYKELNKVPILGAGTDFTINANGYIASFITDAGDPNLLEIPGGNWNFETYFSASSGGGSPSFYVELYKVNSGGTATLIASNSGFPELIAFGTNIISYFSTLAVPTTTLALTDRLAIRYYVNHSGRTITLHTEDNHLCQIITTFTTGITALNGLTAQVQNFAVGTSGTDFAIASATATHTFNLPTASATNRGALSSADWSTFNNKENAITAGTTAQYFRGDKTFQTLNTAAVPELTNLYYTEARVNANTNVAANTAARHNAVTLGTANGLSLSTQVLSLGLASAGVTGALSGTDWSTFNSKQNALTNPVTGTGAQGRVAYWDSTGVIKSDSLFQWNDFSKRLGIGRTPTVSLDVTGAGFFSGTVTASSIIKSGGTSSQYLMADGSVSTLSNLVTGTGTTNYLPKFTGSTTIGNSQIFDNGTSVGVGTNSPSNKLDVLGSAASPNLVGTNAYARFYQSGGYANVTIGALASGSFAGWIQTSDGVGTALALSLQPSGGNVLIGTTSDNGARLQVSGTATFSNIITANSDIHQVSTGGLYWGAASTYVIGVTGNTANGNLSFITGSTVKTTITSSGNVGIGTTSPNTRFHVVGSATINDVIYLQRSSSSLLLPVMNYWNGSGSPLAGTKGDIVAIGNAGGDGLVFANANTEAMRIIGGNVLIGTTTNAGFSQKLQVISTGSSNYLRIQTDNNASYDCANFFTDGTNSVYAGMMRATSGLTGAFTIFTGGAVRLNATSNGNILIGTSTNGASRLRIVGLPTSAAGLSSGDVYNLSGVLMIA